MPHGSPPPSSTSSMPLSYFIPMSAGAVAGISEHLVMYPVDTIKTRAQALANCGTGKCGPSIAYSLNKSARILASREGFMGLWRGAPAVVAGAGPAHAIYFGVYENSKQALTRLSGHTEGTVNYFAVGLSGACATASSEAIFTPADVIKQRIQVRHHDGILDCIRHILRKEGISAFYRAYKTTLIMSIPYTALHFLTYETVKNQLNKLRYPPQEDIGHLFAGACAGGVAATLTNPLDVVKTRLQTCQSDRYGKGSVKQALRAIVLEEGKGALLRGILPRVLTHAPSAAICFATYEAMKRILHPLGIALDDDILH